MKAEKFLQTSMDLYRKLHISTETTAHVGRDHKHFLEGEKLFNWARYLNNMGVTTEWISNLSKYMIVNKEYVFFFGLDGKPRHIYVHPCIDDWRVEDAMSPGVGEPQVNNADKPRLNGMCLLCF